MTDPIDYSALVMGRLQTVYPTDGRTEENFQDKHMFKNFRSMSVTKSFLLTVIDGYSPG